MESNMVFVISLMSGVGTLPSVNECQPLLAVKHLFSWYLAC